MFDLLHFPKLQYTFLHCNLLSGKIDLLNAELQWNHGITKTQADANQEDSNNDNGNNNSSSSSSYNESMNSDTKRNDSIRSNTANLSSSINSNGSNNNRSSGRTNALHDEDDDDDDGDAHSSDISLIALGNVRVETMSWIQVIRNKYGFNDNLSPSSSQHVMIKPGRTASASIIAAEIERNKM